MRLIEKLVSIPLGILFIFSGAVKLNDPIGTAIKLEEYFEVFSTDFASFFHVFIDYALPIAMFTIVLELVLGVALIVNYKMKWVAWILLLLMLFFTFLTFYSAYFNKVTDCGCFGDAIPLTPWTSFYKDVVLMVFTLFLFFRRKRIVTYINEKLGYGIIIASIIVFTLIGVYAIEHLPFIDFRPYAIGKNIKVQMSPSEPLKYVYIMEKDGKKIKMEQYPTDPSYKYVDMELVNPKAKPKITDYSVWNDEGDFTELSFEGVKLIFVIHYADQVHEKPLPEVSKLINSVGDKLDTWIYTASDEASIENLRHEYQIAAPYYYVDGTVLKAMIRSNPGTMLLKDGTVLGKWHYNDLPTKEQLFELAGIK